MKEKEKRKLFLFSSQIYSFFVFPCFIVEVEKPLYKKECHFLSLSSSSSKKKRKKGEKKDTEATIERVKIRKERQEKKKKKKKKKEKQKIKRVIDFCEQQINKIMKIINNKCVYTYL